VTELYVMDFVTISVKVSLLHGWLALFWQKIIRQKGSQNTILMDAFDGFPSEFWQNPLKKSVIVFKIYPSQTQLNRFRRTFVHQYFRQNQFYPSQFLSKYVLMNCRPIKIVYQNYFDEKAFHHNFDGSVKNSILTIYVLKVLFQLKIPSKYKFFRQN